MLSIGALVKGTIARLFLYEKPPRFTTVMDNADVGMLLEGQVGVIVGTWKNEGHYKGVDTGAICITCPGGTGWVPEEYLTGVDD